MQYLDKLNRKALTLTRRGLLQRASLLAGAALLPGAMSTVVRAQGTLPENPFKLGVASGDPLSDGFVIWTRLALYPTEVDYGMRLRQCWCTGKCPKLRT